MIDDPSFLLHEKTNNGKPDISPIAVIESFPVDRDELERLERQIIPLLNSIRRVLGKKPIVVPKN